MSSHWPRICKLWQARLGPTIIAESGSTENVGGTIYFPPSDVKCLFLNRNSHTSYCIWKGASVYFDFDKSPEFLNKVAWSYPNPKEGVAKISGYFAFDTSKVTMQRLTRVIVGHWRFDYY